MLKKLITISITAIASLQAATTYDKSLTDGNDALNYWSDTTSTSLTNHTLVGATEVFTIGSRKNIPNVPTSAIKVSTNKLCSDDRKGLVSCSKSDSLEPRYTDNGLATSGEVNLRTWYKATTPKSVNGVVDDPCTSLSNTGSVVNWWADFGNLRCERTITTYTPKVDSTIYTNKVNSDLFTNKLSSTTTTGGVNIYADKVSTTVYANKLTTGSGPACTSLFQYSCNVFNSKMGTVTSVITLEIEDLDTRYYVGVTNTNKIVQGTGYRLFDNEFDVQFAYQDSIYSTTIKNEADGSVNNPDNFTVNIKNGNIGGITYLTDGFVKKLNYTWAGNSYYTAIVMSSTQGLKLERYKNNTKTAESSYIKFPNTCPSGYTDNGTNCKKTTLACPDASWSDNGANCTKVTPIVSVTSYYCPETYSDMGTYCKKTIQICPDASWTSATATTCSKVVQVCPDASWTDNGTNCRKNVPEYKLFSTF